MNPYEHFEHFISLSPLRACAHARAHSSKRFVLFEVFGYGGGGSNIWGPGR